MTQKNIYIVLGVGRSGTSVITRGLKAIGIDLGKSLRHAADANPKGFWEDRGVLSLNRMLAEELQKPWINVSLLPELKEKSTEVFARYRDLAEKLLQSRLNATSHYGFKDPSTIIFLSFWQSLFAAQHLQEHYVIPVRNPAAFALSVQKFDPESSIEKILLSWISNTYAAITQTQGKKCVIVNYELMLKDPYLQCQRMQQSLMLPDNIDKNEVAVFVQEFLDKKLNHHSIDEKALASFKPIATIAPLCIEMFTVLMQLARDEIIFGSDEFKQKWQEITKSFNAVFPIYKYIHHQTAVNKTLEKNLKAMNHTFSGRIISPFIKIKKYWRDLKESTSSFK